MVRTARFAVLRAFALTGLVALAVAAAFAGGPWQPTVREGRHSSTAPEPMPAPSPAPDVEVGAGTRAFVLTLLLALLAAVVLAGLGISLKAVRTPFQWRSRQVDDLDPDGAVEPGAEAELVVPDVVELREGVAEAWLRLAEHREPTDAIQAAWVAVEEAAARSGVPRAESDTATEFTVAVLDRTAVDPTAIRTLLRLYHRARFSTHGATQEDVVVAGRCLRTLEEGLR